MSGYWKTCNCGLPCGAVLVKKPGSNLLGKYIWVCPKPQGQQCSNAKGNGTIFHGVTPNNGAQPDERSRPQNYVKPYQQYPYQDYQSSPSPQDIPPPTKILQHSTGYVNFEQVAGLTSATYKRKEPEAEEGEITKNEIYLNRILHLEQLQEMTLSSHKQLVEELVPMVRECRNFLAELVILKKNENKNDMNS